MEQNDIASDIYRFLDSRQRGPEVWSPYPNAAAATPRYSPRFGPISMATSSAVSRESEYTLASTATSTATRTYTQPSVFSGGYPASEVSWAPSTAPSHGPRHPNFAEQFAVPAQPSLTPDSGLWCEFHDLAECREVFQYSDEAGWIRHHREHLGDDLPYQVVCWFCDNFVAECTSGRRANFERRMRHIGEHIRRDDQTLEGMRPDFFMVRHLHDIGLLSDEIYNSAMQYTELPPSYQLPEDDPVYDSRSSRYGTRSQPHVHNQAREDRERNHRRRRR